MITVAIIRTSTLYDKISMILACFILSLTFAYLMSSVGNTITDMFQSENTLNKKLRDIHYFTNNRNLSAKLESQIFRYIEYMHYEEFQGSKRGDFIIE